MYSCSKQMILGCTYDFVYEFIVLLIAILHVNHCWKNLIFVSVYSIQKANTYQKSIKQQKHFWNYLNTWANISLYQFNSKTLYLKGKLNKCISRKKMTSSSVVFFPFPMFLCAFLLLLTHLIGFSKWNFSRPFH